jgi:hypothetical protein
MPPLHPPACAPVQAEALPTVAVLLCSFQGERFLAQQLDSIHRQTYTQWTLWASDDGSTDGTWALLQRTQHDWGTDRLRLLRGPGVGAMAHFMALTAHADIDADCYAWADQDDVWEDDKLARAVAWLRSVPADTPALYGSRTQLIDAHGQQLGCSPRFTKPPCFANALVQSMAGGNTMVFNRAARQLLVQTAWPRGGAAHATAHDWWAYQLIAGCGGRLHYDPQPRVQYRQHGSNLVGANRSVRARWQRLQLLWGGQFSGWVDANVAALQCVRHHMPAAEQRTLDAYVCARQQTLLPRLIGFARSGVHRQTWWGNLGLAVAAVFKRL